MTRPNILLADNDSDFLKTRKEFLELAGFVVTATQDWTSARQALDQGNYDLAILDIRLKDDDDEKDTSGLELARTAAYQKIPKIILTGFPSYDAVRMALEPISESLPTAIEFVGKQEGSQELLKTIRRVLKFHARNFENAIDNLTESLQKDYDNKQRQAKMMLNASLGLAIVGILFVIVGIVFALMGSSLIGISIVISGILAELLGYLFFKKAETTNKQIERYHEALLRLRQFEVLLAKDDENALIESKEKYWSQLREILNQPIDLQNTRDIEPSSQSSSRK